MVQQSAPVSFFYMKFSQQHLLNRLSFLHCIFLSPLSQINWPYECGFISGLLFCSMDLSVCFRASTILLTIWGHLWLYSRLWFFQWSCTDVRVGLWRKLSTKELMLLNCGVGEDSWESLRRSNQFILQEIGPGCSLEGLMLKLKLQYFWPPHAKSWLIGKDSDAGRDWGQEEKVTTEDEMAGWHHQFHAHQSE